MGRPKKTAAPPTLTTADLDILDDAAKATGLVIPATLPASKPAEDPIFTELKDRIARWRTEIAEPKVTDIASYRRLGSMLVEVKRSEKQAELILKDQIAKANAAHKSLTKPKGEIMTALEEIHDAIAAPMKEWRIKFEESRHSAEAVLHGSADNERAALLLKADTLAAEAEWADGPAADKLLAQAAELRMMAETMTSVMVADSAPEVPGIEESWPWDAVVDDPMKLMAAILAGEVDLEVEVVVKGEPIMKPLLGVDQSVVRYLAKRYEKDFALPGCRAVKGLTYRISPPEADR